VLAGRDLLVELVHLTLEPFYRTLQVFQVLGGRKTQGGSEVPRLLIRECPNLAGYLEGRAEELHDLRVLHQLGDAGVAHHLHTSSHHLVFDAHPVTFPLSRVSPCVIIRGGPAEQLGTSLGTR
jgi:hypothetical protein